MKLICLSYQLSHFIPIINYILNYNIVDCVFFGDNSLEKYVAELGFTFVCCKSTEFINILEYRKNKQLKKSAMAYKQLHEEVEEAVEKYCIDEIYCDISRYIFYAPVGIKKKLNVTIFWTYNGPTHFNFISYPQTAYPEKENYLGCILAWLKQFYCGEIKSKKILFYFTYPYRLLFHPRYFGKIKYSIDGFFINTNKIICGPSYFVDFFDKKTVFDKSFISYYIDYIDKKMLDEVKNKEKKVYITLGTNNVRYKEAVNVVNHIISCLGNKKELGVIVNIGNEKASNFLACYHNIVFVQNINQVEIISHADYVIFHGGFGTLKECYYLNKKIIVIPFAYDQFANAKLVEKKKIGSSFCVEYAKKVDFYDIIMKT